MNYEGYQGEAFTLAVDANATGLTDLDVKVIAPDDTETTVSATEVGTSSIYKASFVPSQIGTYILEIVSPTDTTINGKKALFRSTELSRKDLGGSGYDSALHSQKILSDKLDSVISSQSSSVGGFIG